MLRGMYILYLRPTSFLRQLEKSHFKTFTMRFVSTIAATVVVALTSSTVSAFVSPSSTIITTSSSHLKMSEVQQPDVSSYMSGARPVSFAKLVHLFVSLQKQLVTFIIRTMNQ
jgi:hypothetical protein